MNNGDYVIIKNETNPIIYIIEEIENNEVTLKGFTHRLKTRKMIDDIELASEQLIKKEINNSKTYQKRLVRTKQRTKRFPIFGRILHIDGDEEYLQSCIDLYKEIGIPAEGIYIKENEVKDKIEQLITYLTPDIIVITGHDIYKGKDIKDLNNYENTKNFMEAVRIIRKRYSNICVIVGACASNFEALIASGANFASSPKRINIHTYDPAVIAIKVASTSCNKIIDFENCIKLIENGRDAFGGIETNGKMKMLM